jgi:O-antigen/teichoic acid export membrane protein
MSMSKLRTSIFANVIARLVSAALLLLTIPLFIRVLGTEAYGVVVLFSSAVSILSTLDFGLGAALNRTLAGASMTQRLQDVVPLARTLEKLFWGAATLVALSGWLAGPAIAGHWLKLGALLPETVAEALRIMIAALCLQIPFTLYTGGLLGLQKQVALSSVVASAALTRTVGTLCMLWLCGPSLASYFWCQLAISAIQTLAARSLLWRALPVTGGASFSMESLRHVRQFSLGMTGISLSGILLTHMDKVVVSRMLPLRDLGYYGVASTAAAALGMFAAPIFNALFPRLTQAMAAGDDATVERLYHRASQFMAVLIWPPACLLMLHPTPILLLWTHDTELVRRSAAVLALLAAGGAVNGIMHLPYALQLAEGWTRLTLLTNIAALLVLGPTMIVFTALLGLPGAALSWPLLNLASFVVGVQIMHRRLLPGRQWHWYARDILAPLLASALICALPVPQAQEGTGDIRTWLVLAALYIGASLGALLMAPQVRMAVAAALGSVLKRAPAPSP